MATMGNLTVLSACVGCSASTADAAVCLPHRIRHGGRDDVESGGLGTMEERSIFEWFEGKVVAGTSWVLWACPFILRRRTYFSSQTLRR